MAEISFTPITSVARGRFVEMIDVRGDQLLVTMPNASGATFVATAIQNELTAAKRGT